MIETFRRRLSRIPSAPDLSRSEEDCQFVDKKKIWKATSFEQIDVEQNGHACKELFLSTNDDDATVSSTRTNNTGRSSCVAWNNSLPFLLFLSASFIAAASVILWSSVKQQPRITNTYATYNNNIIIVEPAANPLQNFVHPFDDPIFAGRRLSSRSFDEVRSSYKTDTEREIPLEVVRLPDDFQGEYRPESLKEFIDLAQYLITPSIDIKSNNPAHTPSPYGIVSICIDMDICSIAEVNQRAYAFRHGYDFVYLSQSIEGIPPKLLKYLVLAWAMEAKDYEWLLMLDADSLITNSNVTIPKLVGMIDEYSAEASTSKETADLILTRGGKWQDVHAINNGIFLLRNSPWSLKHCYEIFTSRYSYTRFLGKTLIDQPIQLSLLLAHNELQWPPQHEVEVGPHVLVVPKHRLNPFHRDNFYSRQDYEEGAQWKSGDFLAHFASRNKYSLMVSLLEEENLEGLPPIESRFKFSLPAPGDDSDAGNCWCDGDSIKCMPKFHVIGVHKAGSKSIMRYLAGNPDLSHSPHVEDPVRWLTDNTLASMESKCEMKKKKASQVLAHVPVQPIFINHGKTSHRLSTCSFDDYVLLHGKASEGMCRNGDLSKEAHVKPMFDEMVIWEHGQYKVRGVSLPKLFHLLQPSAHILITIRDAEDVFYSAYNHFGNFDETDKSPEHFHQYANDLINSWRKHKCTAANFRTCLPTNFVAGGSWLSRAMYSEHIPLWLESFGCSKLHLFDVSVDPMEEVQKLYDFIGAPNDDAARNVTAAAYKANADNATVAKRGERSNVLNKNSYSPMMENTRTLLNDFYRPYNEKVCALYEEYPCIRKPMFQRFCNE